MITLKISTILDSKENKIEFLKRVRKAQINEFLEYSNLLTYQNTVDFLELVLNNIGILNNLQVLDYSISEIAQIQSGIKKYGVETIVRKFIDSGEIKPPTNGIDFELPIEVRIGTSIQNLYEYFLDQNTEAENDGELVFPLTLTGYDTDFYTEQIYGLYEDVITEKEAKYLAEKMFNYIESISDDLEKVDLKYLSKEEQIRKILNPLLQLESEAIVVKSDLTVEIFTKSYYNKEEIKKRATVDPEEWNDLIEDSIRDLKNELGLEYDLSYKNKFGFALELKE